MDSKVWHHQGFVEASVLGHPNRSKICDEYIIWFFIKKDWSFPVLLAV